MSNSQNSHLHDAAATVTQPPVVRRVPSEDERPSREHVAYALVMTTIIVSVVAGIVVESGVLASGLSIFA